MSKNFKLFIPFDVFSSSAVAAAKRYIMTVESQLSQAHTDDRSAALEQFHALPNRDEADYQEFVVSVDRDYEEHFRPILRLTSVVYLYMTFETYVTEHVSQIQGMLGSDASILKQIMRKSQCGLVDASEKYFRDHAKLSFFTKDEWQQLKEFSQVRNCAVHNAGIARNTKNNHLIYALESRLWNGEPIGLKIDRYKGRDAGLPINIEQKFLEYCLELIASFFSKLGTAADARFPR